MPSPEQWWKSLSPQWRQAFCDAVLLKQTDPAKEELENLTAVKVLRLAGPTAPHPNCTVELEDLSGIEALTSLEILIVSHHALTGIPEVAGLPHLKSLFVFNNRIKSLQGVEKLLELEQLYVHSNELESIQEIASLTNLRELYVSDNRLASLAGLTEKHADTLKKFVCLPNENLKQKEIIATEGKLGIICR